MCLRFLHATPGDQHIFQFKVIFFLHFTHIFFAPGCRPVPRSDHLFPFSSVFHTFYHLNFADIRELTQTSHEGYPSSSLLYLSQLPLSDSVHQLPLCSCPCHCIFILSVVGPKYLYIAFLSILKNSKASGLDNIHHEMIKCFGPTTRLWFLDMLNDSADSKRLAELSKSSRTVEARKRRRKPKELQADRSPLLAVQASREDDPHSPFLIPDSDTPQCRGGNPYFFSENLYQSVSFIYASTYSENVHAIHIAMQFTKNRNIVK